MNAGCGRFRRKIDLVVAVRGDLFQVAYHALRGLMRSFSLALPVSKSQVHTDVFRRERLAVVPFDAVAQPEGELGLLLVP